MHLRTHYRLIFLGLLLSLALLPSLAGAASFTLEQVRDYGFPEGLVAAREGSRVAWTTNERGRRNVWVASGPQFEARRLTAYENDDGQELTGLALSKDGQYVVYVRGGEHGGNWDRGLPTNPAWDPKGNKVEIWSVAFAGGVPKLLAEGDYPSLSPDGHRVSFLKDNAVWVAPIDGSVPAKQMFVQRGKPRSLTWSPDGSRLAFVSDRDSHSLIGVFTDERTPIQWIAPSSARDDWPRWSPDGRRIAFIRTAGQGGPPQPALQFNPEPWEIWVADARSGEARHLWSSGTTLRDSFEDYFEWAAGGRIVFRSYQDGWQHLYSLPADGSGEVLALTPGDFMVEHVTLSADRKYLVFNANIGSEADDVDRRHIYKVSVERAGKQALTAGAGIEWSPVVTGDQQVVFLTATAQRPPILGTLPLNGGRVKEFAQQLVPRDYPTAELVIPKRVTFRAKDGGMVRGQLFEARGRAGKHPAVLYMHGGPPRQMLLGWHYMGYYSNDYALNQYLAAQGFAVLAVNYRLGIGYGHEFHYPPNAGGRGAAEYQDIEAAGRYLQSLPNVDPQRVGLYGGSYGGYLTAMGLSHNSDLFVVGVDIHGVHDWSTGYGYEKLFLTQRYEEAPDRKQAIEAVWRSSPVSWVSTWKSPVLFISGDDDRNVQFSQTVDLMQRLRSTSVHQEVLVLVDETHSIFRHANVLKMNDATARFLERYLIPKR